MSVYLSAPGLVRPRHDGARWFDPAIDLTGRKSRYLSRATRYLLASSQQTLHACGDLFSALPQERKGVVIGTNFADYAVRHEADHLLLAEGSGALNSIQAPNVSINIPATQAAIAFRCGGVCATLTTSGVAGIEAIIYAKNAIDGGRVDAVLVGATEDNGSDDGQGIVLPGVLPGSCTLAAFSAAGRSSCATGQHAYEVAAWHWRRYPAAALGDPARAARLRAVFSNAIAGMAGPGTAPVSVYWPQADALSLTMQGWLLGALDGARVEAHVIDPPPAPGWSGAGCNTALMSLQFALESARGPLLFVASHPMGNVVVLYLKPYFCH